MGRRRLPEEERRNWTHSVNFFRDEYRAVSRAAIGQGIAIAQYIRIAVKEKMEGEFITIKKEANP